MSVSELARELGNNRATIYRYESNDIENLPVNVLEPLARALDTTPAQLMGWHDREFPSPIELHKLWDTYGKGKYFVGFILLMIYTGMMPGELFQLKKDMVNWDTYEIKGCGLKTKKRKETPIVFPEVIAPLLLDLCQQSQSRVGNVLCMNRDNFYSKYHDTLKLAGVRDLPPYSCRHTTATALALGNIAPSVIQEVMRHTKFSTTQRYIHPDMASAHFAINSLDKGKAIK